MYQKTTLDNGARVITERVPSRLVSLGIWVEVGSRDEDELTNGSAHFLEHMLFKGTATRSAQQIAREFDILGGMSNAFTSTEHTCYHATVLDDRLPAAIELLGDIFFKSSLAQGETELERQVILQEIAMVEDTPDDRVHELFSELFWPNHPLGNTVLGRPEVVASMDGQLLRAYFAENYRPSRLVVVAAGNVDHAAFVRLWRPWLEGLISGGQALQRQPPKKTAAGKIRMQVRPLEQEHLVLGCAGLPVNAAQRDELLLLSTILGGNMSSKLFQEIREKRGLAYAVYSYVASHSDSGYTAFYLGVDPESLGESFALVRQELRRIGSEAVSTGELTDAVDYLRAGLYLAAENMESRMNRLARNEFAFGRHFSIEEVVAELERVTPDSLREMGKALFAEEKLNLVALGPVKEQALMKEFGIDSNRR